MMEKDGRGTCGIVGKEEIQNKEVSKTRTVVLRLSRRARSVHRQQNKPVFSQVCASQHYSEAFSGYPMTNNK